MSDRSNGLFGSVTSYAVSCEKSAHTVSHSLSHMASVSPSLCVYKNLRHRRVANTSALSEPVQLSVVHETSMFMSPIPEEERR